MKASIFESRKPDNPDKRLSLQVPQELHTEIEAVKSTLKEKAPDKRFNINAICVAALQKAVKTANRELAGNE